MIYLGDSNGNLSNGFDYDQSFGLVFGNSLIPSNKVDTGLYLGKPLRKWKDIYAENINGIDINNYALKSDIPSTSKFALKTDIPDTSNFVTYSNLNSRDYVTGSRLDARIELVKNWVRNNFKAK